MQILQVIPITQSITADTLTYFSAKDVTLGQLVTVPLRKSEITALVVSAEEVINMKSQLRGANYQIRNVIHIHEGHIFSPQFLKVSKRIKDFYVSSHGRILEKFTSSFILKNPEEYCHSENITATKSSFQNLLLQRDYSDRISFYKTLLREKQLRKKSLHIICPTIQSAESLFNELQKNNHQIFLLHSSLSLSKRKKTYSQIITEEKPTLLISTSLFIDTHQYNKDTIIIERESSEYYRAMVAPFIDARVFIQEYAQEAGLDCIWADSVLRPETWHLNNQKTTDIIEPLNKKIFKQDSLEMVYQHTKKPGRQTDKERFEELTKKDKKKFTILSEKSIQHIKEGIQNKEKIFIYSHKKSLAPNIVCNDCGNVARSAESGNPYSLYIKKNPTTKLKERIFIEPKTGESIPAFDICQFCDSWNLTQIGIGTERVFEEISQLFPKINVTIFDGAHAKTKKQIREITETFYAEGTAQILIGTQKAIPYLKNIDRTIISSLDSYFARMSYTIHPEVLSLISELIEKTKHPIILQSRNITEESLPVLKNGMYREYIENEITEREKFNYPPFSTLCIVKKTIPKEYAKKDYMLLNKMFNDYEPQIVVHPATKKNFVQLIIIIELKTSSWNMKHQDEKLWNILSAFDRKTEIRINPKDII
jgi:primosomal protein N'